uniref:glutathione transferase n=1 Tax=Oryza glumipatula TaxID=40148 RepID=A0A0D9Y8M0_9ORYZ
MAPVKVFGPAMSTNVARVLVCLEEVGAEYELVNIDFKAMEHKSPEHLKRNPFGQMPAFQDGDLLLFDLPSKIFRFKQRKLAKCISFSESRAVGRYILRKYKTSEANLLREGNLTEAAMVDIGIEVEIHQYYPVISSIVYECLFNPAMYGVPTNQKVVDDSLEKLKKVLEVYEARLSQNTYLAGNFLSFVDLSHFPFTFYFMATPYASLLDKYPHVKAWWDGLAVRPSIKKVTAAMVLPLKA